MFLLYRTQDGCFIREREELPLSGKSGPIGIIAQAMSHRDDLEWEASEDQMLSALDLQGDRHCIIFDVKPKDRAELSLYRLRHVWGKFSANESRSFCPLAFELEPLFVDEVPPDGQTVDNFKRSFQQPATDAANRIYEFLYLQRAAGGSYPFGRTGFVNSVLLWPDVLSSLLTRINSSRISRGLHPIRTA